jgi:hypothetical protein
MRKEALRIIENKVYFEGYLVAEIKEDQVPVTILDKLRKFLESKNAK